MVETLVGGSNRAVTLALPECFLLPYFTHISYIINLYGLLQKAVIFNFYFYPVVQFPLTAIFKSVKGLINYTAL